MMGIVEINFDGIIGPSHNYAGLSLGNLASAKNAGGVSYPRAAALQGIEKMRGNIALGLTQGIFLPHDRPDDAWLAGLGLAMDTAEPSLQACALSASAMWAANAATISPAADTEDAKCHLTVANLMTMPHRSHEWQGTSAQLRLAFANPAFVIHPPIPAPFGDEGAANHMRLCTAHGQAGIELFVFGRTAGPFPARQHYEASRAVARNHGVTRALFVRQSDAAIAAGAFHNDVVAVANEHVLFVHELAFADAHSVYRDIRTLLPQVTIIEVPDAQVSLSDAISSYLFNAQLVTLPGGEMALILPTEARHNTRVWAWLETMVAGNGPIRHLIAVDVRQSMANGGGPACLRLRVVCDPDDVDQRFLVDDAKLSRIAATVDAYWPSDIHPDQLGDPALHKIIRVARSALLHELDLQSSLSV